MTTFAPDRPADAAPPPPDVPAGRTQQYRCDCEGFKQNDPRLFCLRCLTFWVEGLPEVFSGERLEREMIRAAVLFKKRLEEDPQLAALTLNDALNASEWGIV